MRNAREARRAVEQVTSTKPDAAISSLDLNALGGYIYGTLGAMPIAEYAANSSARSDVARALEEIGRFVSEDEPLAGEAADYETADRSLLEAQQSLRAGDTWQSLARLRRSIEIELRAVADRHGIPVTTRAGAGRLLRTLEDAKAVPSEVAGPLRYAIEVANKAIHGEDVSPGLAEEALYSADRAMRQLASRQPPGGP